MDIADKECVQRCCDGHPEDFRMLVYRYQGLLFSYLGGRMRDRFQVKEAVQESFVRAFMALKKLRKPKCFCPWLLGIAGRVAKEQFRDLKRRQRDSEIAKSMPADSAPSHDDSALDEAIAVLPETYRQVILPRCLTVNWARFRRKQAAWNLLRRKAPTARQNPWSPLRASQVFPTGITLKTNFLVVQIRAEYMCLMRRAIGWNR